MNQTLPLAMLLAVSSGSATLAIPQDQITKKFDSIIVFAPIKANVTGQPEPIKFDLEGQSRLVYFAAFSPSAVQKLIKERLAPQNPELAKSLKFAPFSLSKFDSIVQPSLQGNDNIRVIYVPDPEQVPTAQRLLIEQGSNKEDAVKVSQNMPVVFCPQPAIKATPDSGPLKGKSFVPCSTHHQTVQSMIDKGIATSPQLKKENPKLVAIPITNFASILAKGTDEGVGEIRVITSPSTLKALQRLRDVDKQ
jgi:hypothetical protein